MLGMAIILVSLDKIISKSANILSLGCKIIFPLPCIRLSKDALYKVDSWKEIDSSYLLVYQT